VVGKRWRCDKFDSSVVVYSPDSNGMSTEAIESPMLRALTKQRLVKRFQAGEDLACPVVVCKLWRPLMAP
jgi:hypothetical protein